jgi:hypothetical protein
MTLTEAFAAHGARLPVPPYRIWALMTDDRQEGVVTLWRDHLTADGNTVSVPAPDEPWGHANRNRMEVLRHAIAHCDGRFRAIYLTGDPKGRPKQGRTKRADPDLSNYWRVTRLDPDTGAFTAEKSAERIQPRSILRPRRP